MNTIEQDCAPMRLTRAVMLHGFTRANQAHSLGKKGAQHHAQTKDPAGRQCMIVT